jgi:hypothetical protein
MLVNVARSFCECRYLVAPQPGTLAETRLADLSINCMITSILAEPRWQSLPNTGALLRRFNEDFLMSSSMSRKVHGLIERAMRLRTA